MRGEGGDNLGRSGGCSQRGGRAAAGLPPGLFGSMQTGSVRGSRTAAVGRGCPWFCWGWWCCGSGAVPQTGPGVRAQPCLASGTVLCPPGGQRLRAAPGLGAWWGQPAPQLSHPGKRGCSQTAAVRPLLHARVCVCVCVPVLGLHTGCRRQGGLSWAAPRPLAGSGFVSLSRALGRGAVPSAEASALSKPRSVYPGRKCTAGSWRAAYRRAGPTPGQAAACWCWTTCLSFFVLIKSGLLEQKNKRHKKKVKCL